MQGVYGIPAVSGHVVCHVACLALNFLQRMMRASYLRAGDEKFISSLIVARYISNLSRPFLGF